MHFLFYSHIYFFCVLAKVFTSPFGIGQQERNVQAQIAALFPFRGFQQDIKSKIAAGAATACVCACCTGRTGRMDNMISVSLNGMPFAFGKTA